MNHKIDNGKIVKTYEEKVKIKKLKHNFYKKIGINSILILFKNEFYKLIENSYKYEKKRWGKILYTRKLFLKYF